MGEFHRPFDACAHGLFHWNELVAVTITAPIIGPRCAGLDRSEALELARLCAVRPGLCRVVLRMWKEFVFPLLSERQGQRWAVSYQDTGSHTGNTYRFDGWVKIGVSLSKGAVDKRSGRIGRDKIIWGWCEDQSERAARQMKDK